MIKTFKWLMGFGPKPMSNLERMLMELNVEDIKSQMGAMNARFDELIHAVENAHAAINRISYDLPTHFAENIAMQSGVIEKIMEMLKRAEGERGDKSQGAALSITRKSRKKTEKPADLPQGE